MVFERSPVYEKDHAAARGDRPHVWQVRRNVHNCLPYHDTSTWWTFDGCFMAGHGISCGAVSCWHLPSRCPLVALRGSLGERPHIMSTI